jgi:hypothetical protein
VSSIKFGELEDLKSRINSDECSARRVWGLQNWAHCYPHAAPTCYRSAGLLVARTYRAGVWYGVETAYRLYPEKMVPHSGALNPPSITRLTVTHRLRASISYFYLHCFIIFRPFRFFVPYLSIPRFLHYICVMSLLHYTIFCFPFNPFSFWKKKNYAYVLIPLFVCVPFNLQTNLTIYTKFGMTQSV